MSGWNENLDLVPCLTSDPSGWFRDSGAVTEKEKETDPEKSIRAVLETEAELLTDELLSYIDTEWLVIGGEEIQLQQKSTDVRKQMC